MMKVIKIGLASIVLIAILGSIYNWYESIIIPPKTEIARNQFIDKIEQEIVFLKQKPNTKFSKEYYTDIIYLIEDFHKQSLFSQIQSENDEWKDIFFKNLNYAYTEKFIDQAFFVFKESDWNNADLIFIRTEYLSLQKSQYLEKDSPIDLQLSEIQAILNQYDIVVNFISSCKNFTYTETSLSGRFPHQEVVGLINQSISFRKTGLGNSFVNNCTELRNQMEGVPNLLFLRHVEYLDNKIDAWSGMYTNYKTQKAYADNLYFPIKREIEELSNGIYNSPNFNNEYSLLKKKWDLDSNKAYDYF